MEKVVRRVLSLLGTLLVALPTIVLIYLGCSWLAWHIHAGDIVDYWGILVLAVAVGVLFLILGDE